MQDRAQVLHGSPREGDPRPRSGSPRPTRLRPTNSRRSPRRVQRSSRRCRVPRDCGTTITANPTRFRSRGALPRRCSGGSCGPTRASMAGHRTGTSADRDGPLGDHSAPCTTTNSSGPLLGVVHEAVPLVENRPHSRAVRVFHGVRSGAVCGQAAAIRLAFRPIGL